MKLRQSSSTSLPSGSKWSKYASRSSSGSERTRRTARLGSAVTTAFMLSVWRPQRCLLSTSAKLPLGETPQPTHAEGVELGDGAEARQAVQQGH
eukprot:4178804-Alexandrium_andersonii.AAC.1